jgi:GTP-binding protein Era
VGRPNVGKSTLLNHLIGTKVSITSRKAQTTRHRILGVRTSDQTQFIFVDTPGFQTTHRNQLNRAMNRFVDDAVSAADVVVHMVEASGLKNEDALVESRFAASMPIILVLSKIDRVKNQNDLLPLMAQVAARRSYAAIIPVSAKTGKGVDQLLAEIARHLPEAEPIYDADAFTDRSERFLAAELIREKVFRLSGEEVPYGCDVTIEKFQEEGALRRIHATIIVERAGHKAILLGSKGEKIKRIATEARLDMEKLFGSKVFLELWVKVKGGWADSDSMLKSLGYR